MLLTMSQRYLLQYLLNAGFALAAANAQIYQRKFNIFKYGELLQQVKILKYKANIGFAKLHLFLFRKLASPPCHQKRIIPVQTRPACL